jgi:hypothetical protein
MLWDRFHLNYFALAFTIVVWSSSAHAQTNATFGEPALTKSEARRAINDWTINNKPTAVIDNPAVEHVQEAVARPGAFAVVRSSSPRAQATDNYVVSSYLYELRDKKYKKMGSPNPSKEPIELTLSDVQAFSFSTYVNGLGADVLQDPGELTVTSLPPGATISIDNTSRGITNKDFVVSKGKHLIVVKLVKSTCKETVDVRDDPVDFKCPK